MIYRLHTNFGQIAQAVASQTLNRVLLFIYKQPSVVCTPRHGYGSQRRIFIFFIQFAQWDLSWQTRLLGVFGVRTLEGSTRERVIGVQRTR